jgi:hypothetical protein
MKKFLLPLSLLVAVVAAPAAAQDTLTSRGDVARPAPTFEGLITAMTKTSETIDELTKRQTINEDDILVVDTKPLLEGKGDEMLKVQYDKNKDGIKQLHDVLSKHPAIEARLKKESADPSVSEIIAAEVLADGKIQVYYRKD